MTRVPFVFAVLCFGSVAWAQPVVRDQSVSVPPDSSSTLDIRYVLDAEPAVVTVDILTNGVSIGDENFANVKGDVNCLVQPGPRKIEWKAYKSWPGHRIADNAMTVVVRAWPTNRPPDYAVVDLDAPYAMHYYASLNALPDGGLTNHQVYCRSKLVMRKIPAGGVRFRMGGGSSKFDSIYPPLRWVSLSGDFYMSIYQMTYAQFNKMWDKTYTGGAYEPFEECPVQNKITLEDFRGTANVDWPTAGHAASDSSFLGVWRDRTGLELDLPTEAQWEFAARGGTRTNLFFGNGLTADQQLEYGWFGWMSPYEKYYGTVTNAQTGAVTTNTSWKGAHPVGRLKPNPYGLYDVYGNMWDQCLDYFANANDFFLNDAHDGEFDPVGVADNTSYVNKPDYVGGRVLRGGSSGNSPNDSSSAMRYTHANTKASVGHAIRLVCPAVVTK